MFQNYSQTYASQILALAGLVEIIGRIFGWPISSNDAVFILGVVANFAGSIWAIYHRVQKGDISALGVRK